MQNILVYGQSNKLQQLLTYIVEWVHLPYVINMGSINCCNFLKLKFSLNIGP